MKITKRQLRRLIRESLISEQVMWHSTAPENIEAILSQGLQAGRASANTMAGAWADEFYGTRPIYLSVEKGKYEGTPLAVNTSGLGLVADLPTLVDTGAYQEEEGMYWDEGSEPAQMIDIVDEDGMVYFDELLSPGSAAAQAAIELTGTAAVVQDIPSKNISKKETNLEAGPSAAESEWASKSQEDKDAHVKNAVWETMAWKRYRKHAQEEGLPFDPDSEEDMKIARAWWKEQPESKQFESRIRITKGQLKRLIREALGQELELYVVIGNAGRGRQNMWPTSAEPEAYSRTEAEKIVKDLNSKMGRGYTQIHYHTKPLSQASEYIEPGQEAHAGLTRLIRRLEDEDLKAAEEILGTRAGSYRGTTLPDGRKIT